jgi:hypothetical protein
MQVENDLMISQVEKINKDISNIKNVLSGYSDYFKSNFSEGPGGTKNDEFKISSRHLQAQVVHLENIRDEDIICRLKSSNNWNCMKLLLETDYFDMNLLDLITWLDCVSKYTLELSGIAKAYRGMKNDVEKYGGFNGKFY